MKKKSLINSCSHGWSAISPELVRAAVLVFVGLALACAKCSDQAKQEPESFAGNAVVLIFPQSGKTVKVAAEVAATEEQQRQGLMFRTELGENNGMLFVFPYSSHHEFWMKNTLIPLDMIFIGEELKIKGLVENARPESTDTLGISDPSKYVLEVNGGFCHERGIQSGDSVKILGTK